MRLNRATTGKISVIYLKITIALFSPFLETLERWIIFGFAICHSTLQQNQTANELWVLALSSGWVIPLFRWVVLEFWPQEGACEIPVPKWSDKGDALLDLHLKKPLNIDNLNC